MNMRYFKLYIIPALLAALVSCTKADGPEGGVSPEGRAVSISVGVDSPEGGASGVEAAVAGLPATRAEGSTTYSGSTLGLFLDYGKDSFGDPVGGTTKSNVLWSNDGSNNWTTKGQMLWGKSSDKVGVYAYAPYLERQTDASGVVFTIPTDQSEGLGAADLLWWYKGIEEGKKADVAAKDFDGGKIDIAFRHALIKLTVNFTLASQFEGQNISIKEAWFHGSGNKVKIDFSGTGNSGVPCVARATEDPAFTSCSIKMHNCSSEGKLSCEVLFFPHSLTTGSKLLTVTLSDGRDYILTLGEDLKLSEGYVTGVAYEMAVTVGKNKLEGGVITVSPWTEKDSLGDDFGTDATEYSEWDGAEIAKAYAGGDGTSEDPYQIATAAQLAFLAQEANKEGSEYQWANTRKYFKLTADINLKGHEWTPIGSESKRFAGSFDGDGHVIVNLNVKGAGRFAGLFGWIRNGATVKNLVIRNASVSAVAPDSESAATQNTEAYSGIVAAYCAGGCTISNCKVDGTVTSDYCAGGIVGYSANDSAPYNDGAITYCTADVVCSVAGSTEASYCGGIAGHSCVKMYGCTVRGRIDGPCDVGGLVGWLGTGGSFDYPFSYVYADVGISKVELTNLSPSIGGLVGSAYSSGSKIFNCYMKGKVSCAEGLALDDVQSFYIGGIVGSAQNVELAGCHYRGSISVGKPANGKLYTGFFIGELMSGVKATNNNSYMIDGAAGLPVYGYNNGGDDSEIYIEAIE